MCRLDKVDYGSITTQRKLLPITLNQSSDSSIWFSHHNCDSRFFHLQPDFSTSRVTMRRRLFISCITGVRELQGSSQKLIEQFVCPRRVVIVHPTVCQRQTANVDCLHNFFTFLSISKFRTCTFLGMKTKNICLFPARVNIIEGSCMF